MTSKAPPSGYLLAAAIMQCKLKKKKLKSKWSFNEKFKGSSLQGQASKKTAMSLSVAG